MTDYGRPIEFGIFLDPAAEQSATVLDTIAFIDELGFDWIGIQDHPYNRAQLDAMTLIGMGLARTERVRFVPDVATLSLRSPAMLAKQAVTLDLLGNGRFELGLGSGAFWDAIVAMGGPRRSPGEAYASLDEAIDILRAAFDGARSVDHQGEIYQLRGWRPGPAPAHRIGIWLGVYGPRALRLAGRKADGWVPSLAYVPPAAAREAMQTIDSAAVSAGRNPADIRRAYNIWGGFIDAPPAPIDETSGEFAGSPAAWAAFLTHLATSIGFDTFLFGVPPDSGLLRRIAGEILPRVREQVELARGRS
ncbi:MAG TPA: LLM class flavin-dependent oxidoreductase [Thermomicrobiales bacterium]|nr:LLM class flavin-dependent oxidoreductase [Thermomicrobiales bacterium]